MRHTGKIVYYTADELVEFAPLWAKLAERGSFVAETERIRDVLLLADEESIMNGSSPLLPELKRYEQEVRDFIKSQNPEWSDEKRRAFHFYCLYHEDQKLEFDIAAAAKRAGHNATNKDSG